MRTGGQALSLGALWCRHFLQSGCETTSHHLSHVVSSRRRHAAGGKWRSKVMRRYCRCRCRCRCLRTHSHTHSHTRSLFPTYITISPASIGALLRICCRELLQSVEEGDGCSCFCKDCYLISMDDGRLCHNIGVKVSNHVATG